MRKAIATTTINAPTVAIEAFVDIAEKDDWHIFIAGDLKTPHKEYFALEQLSDRVTYLHPETQVARWGRLSNLIGWNCIQRRNMAIMAAFEDHADVIALVDDDNIPLKGWGRNLTIGREVECDVYSTFGMPAFEPMRGGGTRSWHRGFPIQLLDVLRTEWAKNGGQPSGEAKIKPLVQADLWLGEPDVDAVCRIAANQRDAGRHEGRPFVGEEPGPFNSQNTFISREVLPAYFLFPGVGRMDDIWASYVTQAVHPGSVCYSKSSVFQDRNPHDLSKDLQAEMLGYRHTLDLIRWLMDNDPMTASWPEWMPQVAIDAWVEWIRLVDEFEST